jgi:hypothetical protein
VANANANSNSNSASEFKAFFFFSSFAFSPTSWALHKEYPVWYGIMIGYGKGTGERDRNMEKGIVTLVLGIYSFAAPLGGPTFVISL